MASAGFNLKLGQFKKAFIDVDRVRRNVESRGKIAMSLIGRNHRQAARRKIKFRRVTSNQWKRLKAARDAGDERKVRTVLNAMNRKHWDSAPPGSPPFSHVSDHPVSSLRAIYYAPETDRVLIGPVKARTSALLGSNRSTVPELMEFGGTARVKHRAVVKRNAKGKVTRRDRITTRWRQARYAPHPFMAPTLKEQLPKNREVIARVFGSGRAAA